MCPEMSDWAKLVWKEDKLGEEIDQNSSYICD
jgi:hypothetical protein